MKLRIVLLTLLVFSVVLTGCKKNNTNDNDEPTTAPTTTATQTPTGATTVTPVATNAAVSPTGTATDVVTTASIVNTEDAFLSAISAQGTWIIAILNDLTTDQELVLEGEFKNGKQDDAGNDVIQRKIALYAQDADRNVTARYTLTAPKITIKSPNASIQKGIFKGDIYVDVNNFELVDQQVDGNIYFTKQEYKDSFVMDDTSKVSGKQEVVQQ